MSTRLSRFVLLGFFAFAAVASAALFAADLPASERRTAWVGFGFAAVAGAALAPAVKWLERQTAGSRLALLLASPSIQLAAVLAGVVVSGVLVHVLGSAGLMLLEGFCGALVIGLAVAYGRFSSGG